MAIPTWVTGEVLTASDVNEWFVPLLVVKAADESITSSTAMQNDNELVLAIPANATFVFDCYLNWEGGIGGDIKWQWTGPAGYTLRYTAAYRDPSTNNANVGTGSTGGTVNQAGGNGAGSLRAVMMNGSVVTSSTAGNLQLQWAQNSSSGTATIVHAQSYLRLYRYA